MEKVRRSICGSCRGAMWKNIVKRMECQGVVTKDGGQAKLQRQYAKGRKPGKKYRRQRREEIN